MAKEKAKEDIEYNNCAADEPIVYCSYENEG